MSAVASHRWLESPVLVVDPNSWTIRCVAFEPIFSRAALTVEGVNSCAEP